MVTTLRRSTVMTRKLDPDAEGETRKHQVRIPEAEWTAAQATVEKGGMSALIRQLLAEHVKRHQRKSR